MKKLILGLLLFVPFFVQAQSSNPRITGGVKIDEVFDRTILLDSIGYKPTLAAVSMTTASNTVTGNTTSSGTFYSEVFALDADTISFVVEITDIAFFSGGATRTSRTYDLASAPDSLGLAIKLQPLSSSGLGSTNAVFNNSIAAAGDWRYGYIRVDTLRSNAVFGVVATKADRITFVDNIKTATFPNACTLGRLVVLCQNWKAVDRQRFRLVVKSVKKWSGA